MCLSHELLCPLLWLFFPCLCVRVLRGNSAGTMAAPVPVVFNETLNLTAVGAASETIKFGSCAMESDKYITVRNCKDRLMHRVAPIMGSPFCQGAF